MTKMEKEAIKHFKNYENKLVYEINEKDKKYAKTLLNLIDKLQKEIGKIRQAEMEVIKENTIFSEEIDKQSRLIDKLQKENKELKEKIKEYEAGKEQKK